MKKSLLLIVSLLSCLLLGCEVGLGNAVDLEAPVITITSPLPQSNVKRNVLLEGTCTDNLRVTEVVISNKITGEKYGNAEITGDKWKIPLYLDEGEIEIVCQAKDAANNSSTKSIRTILLLVDETAPEGLSWYIERGKGIQVALQSKEALEQLNLEDATNKYVPQNEAFTIHGNFYDAMSIDTITLTLSENGRKIISKTLDADSASPNYIGDGKSVFAPAFKFTHNELVAADTSMSTGMHYLEVSFFSQDEHKNSVQQTLPYLLWYPESDIPGIMQAATVNDNLSVSVGSSIFLHFFDDDELTELAWDFLNEDAVTDNGITKDNVITKKENFSNKKSSEELAGTSDFPTQISAGDATGIYYLLAYAKDVNGKVRTRFIKTIVADKSFPMLIIESPVENSIPSIVNGTKFKFTGYSYDTAGSKNIKIAYIPNSSTYNTNIARENRAKELFKGEPPATGEIYKSYSFPVNKVKNAEDQWYKESFEFEFDVLEDFGTEKNKTKFFELALEDTDGNIAYKQFTVSGDSQGPEIDIKEPADNMIVCDYRNNDLLLKFKASKESGLGIEESSYKIERKDYESTLKWTDFDTENGYKYITIPKATLKKWAEGTDGFTSDTQPVFVFYAEDVLGNSTVEQRTVVLSPLPVLEKVIVDTISGTHPAGTEIIIQTKFSDSVKVTGTPRIALGGIELEDGTEPSVQPPYYAVFDSGNRTDTLSFKFTVPENVKSTKLVCTGDGIDLNGGKIETNVEGTGNAEITFVSNKGFWNDSAEADIKKTIALDGFAPEVESITPQISGISKNADGKWYVNANHDIQIKVKYSEAVLVSGSPALVVGGMQFIFQSMQDDTVTFVHTVIGGENGTLTFNASSFSDAVKNAIKDSAGNKMKGQNVAAQTVVIDTAKPAIPVVSGVAAGVYNIHPTITVTTTDIADTDKLEYSTNGGLSWTEYDDPYQIPETGNFIIQARATDKAGNVSDASEGIEITINDTFPVVNEISIAKTDGKYKRGSEIDFKVFLQDDVQPYTAGEATLTFKGITAGNTITKTVNALASDSPTNKIVLRYIVADGDDFNGVQITSVSLGNIQDKYTNKASDQTTAKINSLLAVANGPCKRTGILLDGKDPVISKYKLGNSSEYTYGTDLDKISSAENTAGSFTITLTFDEKIIKESGTIILQRKGNWAIPPVMDSTTFSKWYNKIINDADKQKLIQKEADGSETLDSLTGQPVGPYKKITHGLVESGGKMIPDKATKYVLDFQYGLYETSGVVKNIRDVLSSIGYDKHTVEVRNVTVNNNTVTITFPDEIEDGQNWELIIPSNSFHDETGNYFKGLKSEVGSSVSDYKLSLWSDNVAIPVVRVDRYSHGMGAYGLNVSGVETQITGWTSPNAGTYVASSGANLKPLGYAKVRIDCETPGASVYYKTVNGGTANSDTYKWASKNGNEQQQGWNGSYSITGFSNRSNEDDTHKSSIPDIAETSLVFSSEGTAYSGIINVGDTSTDAARYKTARKDYVSAYATKTGFRQSTNGYEGVFKTVVIAYKDNSVNQINIEGGTAEGGEPIVFGFPVRDATSDNRYSKNAYHYQENLTFSVTTEHVNTPKEYTEENANFFSWVSYDIITDWAILQHRSNYSSKYPKHSYGQLIFLSNYSTWE